MRNTILAAAGVLKAAVAKLNTLNDGNRLSVSGARGPLQVLEARCPRCSRCSRCSTHPRGLKLRQPCGHACPPPPQAFVPFDPAGAVEAGALDCLITVVENLWAAMPAPGQPVSMDYLADGIFRVTPAAAAISAMVGMQASAVSSYAVCRHHVAVITTRLVHGTHFLRCLVVE